MRSISERSSFGLAPFTADVARYNVLLFGSRADAVRFCLRISDVVVQSSEAAHGDPVPTLWLAATDLAEGPFLVYACDLALAAAQRAGIPTSVSGRVRPAAMPAARCLVVGDTRRLPARRAG